MSKVAAIKTVTVYRVERGPLSNYGNPSYVFKSTDGDYRTTANNGIAYALENDLKTGEARWKDESGVWHDGPVSLELTLTKANRVISYKIMGAAE